VSIIDLATNGGPPEGERGSLAPQRVAYTDQLFGTFDRWTGSLGREPSERDLAHMIDRDGKAQALEQVLTLPLRWADVSIDPAEGDTGEAELVSAALLTPPHEGGMSTPLDHVVAQMTAAVWQRRAFFEKVFRVEGDAVTYKKLALRPAESCKLRRDKSDGGFDGFEQRVTDDTGKLDIVTIPADKALVYIHDQARAPLLGRSALQTAFRAFEAKQKIRFLWFAFLERFATPWAAAKDENEPPMQLARNAAALKGGGVLGLNGAQSIELFEPSSDGGAFQKCMDWLSAEMSQSVLASFTDLAQQGSGRGSYALSKDQSDFFLRACEARLGEMGATLTIYAAADLVKWNRGAAGRTPTIRFGKLSDEHAEAARDLFKTLLAQPMPDPRVPAVFFDLLLERVSSALGPQAADRVRRAIEEREQASPVEQLQGVAGEAAQMVADAGMVPAA
jgi:hypothetical protein